MAHGPVATSTPSACRLDAYRLAVELDSAVARLGLTGDLRAQITRASASAALCLAEGWARCSARDKRHFYSMALGSARECAAILELVHGRTGRTDRDASEVLRRVIRTIEGLVAAMERR